MSWPVFQALQDDNFEQIVFGYDEESGLKSIIAIHDTTLGPAFGGARMMLYKTEEEALIDVMKLAQAMTYKNAAAGINFGGGKAVIIGDPKKEKSEALLRVFGRFIAGLGGRYIAGVDIGTTEEDMVILHQETHYNVSMPEAYGGGGSTSKATAYGVFQGIKALVEEIFPDPFLQGKSVAIQGVGSIGTFLTEYLLEEGSKVWVCDVDAERLERIQKRFPVTVVPPEKIYDVKVDIFSPNALGGILNQETIPRLQCRLVAGAANNQLLQGEKDCQLLMDRGITYGVDFLINAGGVMNNAHQFTGYNRERAYAQIRSIGQTLKEIYRYSKKEGVSPLVAAQNRAEKRIQMGGRLKSWYLEEEKRMK